MFLSALRLIALSLLFACSATLRAQPHVSDISNQPVISPYLEYHRDDLVRWQPWSKETLQLAHTSKKLILLSSGYYSCHFCHVMKQESFENPVIAEYINRHFIPVLIDREINTELDAQLLRFMEIIGAPQGWPLNVVLTPDAYPLVGTVYRPAQGFLEFLQRVQANWNEDMAYWQRIAKAASQQIISEATVPAFIIESMRQQQDILEAYAEQAHLVIDREYGGFGNGAKYPMSPQLMALLNFYAIQPSAWLETHLRTTLARMASTGLHDPHNGGFFRYTTDRQWSIPHYEKMLYDNAQLALIYLEAAQIFDEPAFQRIADMTLEFMLNSMLTNHGGFVSSLSAVDERGKDGGYYLWTPSELESILEPREIQLATHLWRALDTEAGQGGQQQYLPRHYPATTADIAAVATTLNQPPAQIRTDLASLKQKMTSASKKRRLLRDEKLLAGWNGLTLLAFTRAARLTGESRYQQTAQRLVQFISKKLWIGNQLQRTMAGGISDLADYAYISAGLIEYAQLTGDPEVLQMCARLVTQAWQQFYLDGFWRRSEDLELLLPFTVYPVTLPDSELPSPSAMLVAVTMQLDNQIEPELTQHVLNAQRTVDGDLLKSPFFYGTQIITWLDKHATP